MNKKWFLFLTALALLFVLFSGDGRRADAQTGEICLVDDGSGASLKFNSTTGNYTFCTGSKTLTGTGSVRRSGNNITLEHSSPDRKVVARVNTSVKNASASVQSPVGKTLGTISDSDTGNSSCGCK